MRTNDNIYTTIIINYEVDESQSKDLGEIRVNNINSNIEGILYDSTWYGFFRIVGDGKISLYENASVKDIVSDDTKPIEMDVFLDLLSRHYIYSEVSAIKNCLMTALDIAAETPAAATSTNGKVTIKEVTATETGRPVAILDTPDNDKYLMDFRSYCISINGNMKGDGCEYGSTRPIPFKELNKNSDLTKAEYIRMSIATVLEEYCRGRNFTLAVKTKFDWSPEEKFMEFVKAVFAFEFPDAKWPYII